jgi:hypothetical protein
VNEALRTRILRALETLPDEKAYLVLDYVEFLESKYAERSRPSNFFARLTEKVEDTMRAGRLPLQTITGTVGLMDSAQKVMRGLAAAGEAVLDEGLRAAGVSPGEPGSRVAGTAATGSIAPPAGTRAPSVAAPNLGPASPASTRPGTAAPPIPPAGTSPAGAAPPSADAP